MNTDTKKNEKIDSQKTNCKITLENLANVLVENNLSEVEYEENGRRIYLSRKIDILKENQISPLIPSISPTQAQEDKKNIPVEQSEKNHQGTAIRSPMVGVAYIAPEPGSEPFVRVGDNVNPGQTLLIIEAMKVLNPIKATKSGKVLEILVHDQKPVEYDEPLIIISE